MTESTRWISPPKLRTRRSGVRIPYGVPKHANTNPVYRQERICGYNRDRAKVLRPWLYLYIGSKRSDNLSILTIILYYLPANFQRPPDTGGLWLSSERKCHFSPWMFLGQQQGLLPSSYMRVDLRGRDGAVPQQRLDVSYIHPCLQK